MVVLTGRSGSPGAQLVSVAAAQPETVLTAADLGAAFGRSAEWVTTRTGIGTLRRSESRGELIELSVRSGTQALAAAGLGPADVDVIVTVSCSIGEGEARSIASSVSPMAAALHVNIACSGFCYALGVAEGLIRDGSAAHVLILAVEHMTPLLDPADLGTSIIFGDGAGAAVVSPALGEPGIGPTVFGSAGGQGSLIACDADGVLQMAGREVFRWAVDTAPALALAACAKAGVTTAEIRAFVPHQANKRIVDAIVPRIGLEHAVIATDVERSGNTSGASIPIALDRLLSDSPELGGELALLIGFGAGLSYAGQVVRLPVAIN